MRKFLAGGLLVLAPLGVSATCAAEMPAPVPGVELSSSDHRVLAIGEISEDAHLGGGAIGTLVGFGLGHAVQGRYGDKGWIFTIGDIVGMGLFLLATIDCAFEVGGSQTCESKNRLQLGTALFVGFRIWEIVDVWAGPPAHNRRYRELKGRVTPQARLFLTPVAQNSVGVPTLGATAGVRFTF
jgi:hypothetical protein